MTVMHTVYPRGFQKYGAFQTPGTPVPGATGSASSRGCGDALPGQPAQGTARSDGSDSPRAKETEWAGQGFPGTQDFRFKTEKVLDKPGRDASAPYSWGPREWKVEFFFAPSGHACEKVTKEVFKGKSPRTIGIEEQTPAGEGE